MPQEKTIFLEILFQIRNQQIFLSILQLKKKFYV